MRSSRFGTSRRTPPRVIPFRFVPCANSYFQLFHHVRWKAPKLNARPAHQRKSLTLIFCVRFISEKGKNIYIRYNTELVVHIILSHLNDPVEVLQTSNGGARNSQREKVIFRSLEPSFD